LAGWLTLYAKAGDGRLARPLKLAGGLILGLMSAIYLLLGAQAYAADTAFIEHEMVATARWVERNTSSDALIAVHDIGAMGYFAKRPLLDLAGLITPDIIPYLDDMTAIEAYILASEADYLVTAPGWPYDGVMDGTAVLQYSSDYEWTVEQGEAVEEMAAEEIVEEEIEIPAEPKIAETERMPADGAAEAEEAPPEGVFEEAADEEMANAADIIEDITEDAAASAPAEDVEEEAESVVDEVEETEADSPLIEMPAGEGVDMDMADDVMATATVVMETAVSTTTPTPPPHAQPESAPSPTLTNTQLAQISLLILFVILLTLTLYARQKR